MVIFHSYVSLPEGKYGGKLKEIKHQTKIPKYHYHQRWPGSMAAAALVSPRTLPAARSDVHASALFGFHHR